MQQLALFEEGSWYLASYICMELEHGHLPFSSTSLFLTYTKIKLFNVSRQPLAARAPPAFCVTNLANESRVIQSLRSNQSG